MEDRAVKIEYDEVTGNYYVICTPVPVVGLGATKLDALEDLKQAACFAIECDVSSVLHDIDKK